MKHAGKIIIIGVGIGVVLLIVQKSLRIDEAAFSRAYWLAAPIVIIGVVLINLLYNLFYINKMREIGRLLYTGKAREYVAGMEALLRTAKGKNLRHILALNLTAGYVELKEFDAAIGILEELSAQGLKGDAANVVHHINLCTSYFETGQYEKAMALYRESRPLFEKFRSNQSYGAYIAVLDMLAAAREQDYDRAEELLKAAMQMYDDPRVQKAFREIGQKLEEGKDSSMKIQ